jgi:hypothetical protein
MEQLKTVALSIDKFIQEIEDLIEFDKAYGSSITLLTCQVDAIGNIAGRFRDVWNNRVFDYLLNSKGLSYKPSLKLSAKLDSQRAINLFETYSAGYLSAVPHLDGVKKRTKKPKCGNTNYNCGLSCIGVTKNCQIDSGLISRDRINKLQESARLIAFEQVKLKGVGGRFNKPSDLIKLSRELQKQRITGTKNLSNFSDWNRALPNDKIQNNNALAREEAIKDFLTPKKIANGQIVPQIKKTGVVSFYKGITDESAIVRLHEIAATPKSNASESEIQQTKKSIAELGVNLAMPLVCLTVEEDIYSVVTGKGIHEAFEQTTKNELEKNLWVTIIPTNKKNALVLADDYIQQSTLNTSKNLEIKSISTRQEAIKQVYYDPKSEKGGVQFYKKEPPQRSYVVLNQLKIKEEIKYSKEEEEAINIATKSMAELKTNLSAPLVCFAGDKEDEYQMLSGHLLLEAAKRAGLDRLRVMVLPAKPEYAAHFVKDFELQNTMSREKVN